MSGTGGIVLRVRHAKGMSEVEVDGEKDSVGDVVRKALASAGAAAGRGECAAPAATGPWRAHRWRGSALWLSSV